MENEQLKSTIKTTSLEKKRRYPYSKADLTFIEENISTMKLTEMAVYLNRDFDSIHIKVCKMGLNGRRIYSFKPYTATDVVFLQENVKKHTILELVEMTGRTFFSIENKLRKLGLKAQNPRSFKRLTDIDIKFIQKNHHKLNNKQLAEKLNKNTATISKKLESLGLRFPKRKRSKQKLQ